MTLVSLKVPSKIDPSAVDRGTLGQVRPEESWNRRAWIEADLKFEQSPEPAISQVALRKAEFDRRTWRGRWAVRKITWEWMFRRNGWTWRCGRALSFSRRPTINGR